MISVCMATYNGEKYLKEQIDSILIQLEQDDELIISDDGSTDATLSIIASYEDHRIKIFQHKKSKQKFSFGYTAANFENALLQAKGEYIFLTDQDDVWLDHKIVKFKEAFIRYDLILSDCSYVDSNLEILVSSKNSFEQVRTGILKNFYKCGYLGASMAFKRWLLTYVLPFPENVPHDLWIGLVGNYIGHFGVLSEVTLLYRRHDKNVSATNNKLLTKQKDNRGIRLPENQNTLFYKLHYRWNVCCCFIKFILKYYLNCKNKLFLG